MQEEEGVGYKVQQFFKVQILTSKPHDFLFRCEISGTQDESWTKFVWNGVHLRSSLITPWGEC